MIAQNDSEMMELVKLLADIAAKQYLAEQKVVRESRHLHTL